MRALAVVLALTLLSVAVAGKKDKQKKNAAPALAEIRTHHVSAAGGLVFVGRTAGLVVRDAANASDEAQASEVGALPLSTTVLDMRIEGEHAFLAAGTHGLLLADVADPSAPRLLHRHDRPGKVRRLLVREGLVYLAESREGLTILDISDPARPLQRASISTSGELFALAARDEVLATAERSYGARLFDLDRPSNPRELARLRDSEHARDVVFAGERLLVAAGPRGLLVYDLSSIRKPQLLTAIVGSHPATHVSYEEGLAVVSIGPGGLQLLDPAADPASMELGSVVLPRGYPAGRVALSDGTAYVAIDRWGVATVDLADPREPEVLAPRERTMRISFP